MELKHILAAISRMADDDVLINLRHFLLSRLAIILLGKILGIELLELFTTAYSSLHPVLRYIN